MRIASFLASGTEIACALGLGDDIIAISHECDYPPDVLDRPRVTRPRFDPAGLDSGGLDAAVREAMASGGVYEIDVDVLRRLKPDIVLTQAVCDVCAVPAADAGNAVASMIGDVRVVSLDAHTMDGILATIGQIGEAARAAEAARRLIEGLRSRLDGVRAPVADRPRPSVLGIEWLDPPFVPGHWVPEMVDVAGGLNIRGTVGGRSVQVDWEELMHLDPDVLLVMPCGYKLDAAHSDADRFAERLIEVAPRAVDEGRAFVVDASSYFNRSGPRSVDGVEILAALLHPDLFPDVELEGRAATWHPPSS